MKNDWKLATRRQDKKTWINRKRDEKLILSSVQGRKPSVNVVQRSAPSQVVEKRTFNTKEEAVEYAKTYRSFN